MRELGIKSRMQKRYRKPKTVVTVDQKPNYSAFEVRVHRTRSSFPEGTCSLPKSPPYQEGLKQGSKKMSE